jgi:hypothetical protein
MQNILLGLAVAVIGLKLLSKNDNFSNTLLGKNDNFSNTLLGKNDNFSNTLLGKNDNFSNTWIENSRNNYNYKNYPPCFNLSTEAQKIYDILASKNMIEKHKILFEVYSMLFCQIKYLKIKKCSKTMLLDRINDLVNLGANINVNNTDKLLNYINQSHIKNINKNSLIFLNKILFLITKEIEKIVLPQNEISLIIKLNNYICLNFFQTFFLNC